MRWWGLALILLIGAAVAQAPQEIWGLIYNATPPTLTDKQQTVWRGNNRGSLSTDIITGPCSNSLDYSDGCNSQYWALFKGLM